MLEMLDELFSHFKMSNYIEYDPKTEIITARLNGVVQRFDGMQVYLWADRTGRTLQGKEIKYMDGNSEAYDLIDPVHLSQDEYCSQIDFDDLRDYLREK